MANDIDKFFDAAMKYALQGGELIKKANEESTKSFEFKLSAIDLVTETDKAVEKLLIEGLSKDFPDHKFIGEESSESKITLTDDPTWIIDPVDGTMNFVHGYPNVCISIALVINKVTEIGIIYNPFINWNFTAKRGRGSFLNDKKISVSKTKELSLALIGFELGTSRNEEKGKVVLENVNRLAPVVHGIRSAGSCAMNMALVAMGASDAYYEFGVHAWDYAAGDILVREAGGVAIDPAGGPLDLLSCRMLCAATQELSRELVDIIVQYYPKRDDQ
ncbi:inositol monophosphatase 1 [Nilaparvata lugens]|uniref:inositol monophosphatase 1 n=1 Tax=Nilaparvata lugens TaxID=108931 RepID=UPI00193CB26B|nr:inositol monophosphatase 1 [Nilaparvata lugens]